MALVTLARAKGHLRIALDLTDQDDDIYAKVQQASTIILDYLKRRAHESQTTATIDTSSQASPTVITTVSPHGFSTGAAVFIAGHVDAVPTVNGLWTISAASGSTFTIPVAVTTAGTGGTVSVTWTEDTVPGHVQASVLLMIGHLYEHREGDATDADEVVWQAIERLLMRARDPALA